MAKATPLNLSQIVPPTKDQLFKHMNLREMFPCKPPQGVMFIPYSVVMSIM